MPPKKIATSTSQAKGKRREPERSVKSSAATPGLKDAEEYLETVITPKKLNSSRITDYFTKTPPKTTLFNSKSDFRCENAQEILKFKNVASPQKSLPSDTKKPLRLRERKRNIPNCKNSPATSSFRAFEPSPAKQRERSVVPTVPCFVRLFNIVNSIPDNVYYSHKADNHDVVTEGKTQQRTNEVNPVEQTSRNKPSQQSETKDPVELPNIRRSLKRKSVGVKEPTPKKRSKIEELAESNGCTSPKAKLRSSTAKDFPMNLASPKLSFTSSASGGEANVCSRENSRISGSQCDKDRKASRKITKDELTAAAYTFRSISRKIPPVSESEKDPMCESIESLFLVTCKSNYNQALRILQDNLNIRLYPRISCMETLFWVIVLGQQPKVKFIHGRRQTPKEMTPFPLSSRYEFVTACELLNKTLVLHPPSVVPLLDSIYRRLLYANEDTAYEGWNKIEDLLQNCDFSYSDEDNFDEIMANVPQLPERQWFAIRWLVRVLEADLESGLATEQRGGVEKSITARIFWHKGKIGIVNYRTRRLTEILRDALIGNKHRALEEASKLIALVATVIQKMESDDFFPLQLNSLCQDFVNYLADCLQNWAQQSCDNMNEALHALKPTWIVLAICQRWLKQLDPDWNVPDADITLSTVFRRYLTTDASYAFNDGDTSLSNPALKLQALPPVLRTCIQRFLIVYQEYFGIRDILAILVHGASSVERGVSSTAYSSLSEYEYQRLLKDLRAVKSCKLLPTDRQSSEGVGLLII